MLHPDFARLLLSGIAVTQAVATIRMDLHRSHATNPLWPPHARFHLVWQVLNLALLAFAEVALLWWSGPFAKPRFYVAACLIALTLLGFWAALATMRLYAGALFDRNGILPRQVKLGDKVFLLEMNLVAVLCGSVVLVIAMYLYR
jgi:hypothetical protein